MSSKQSLLDLLPDPVLDYTSNAQTIVTPIMLSFAKVTLAVTAFASVALAAPQALDFAGPLIGGLEIGQSAVSHNLSRSQSGVQLTLSLQLKEKMRNDAEQATGINLRWYSGGGSGPSYLSLRQDDGWVSNTLSSVPDLAVDLALHSTDTITATLIYHAIPKIVLPAMGTTRTSIGACMKRCAVSYLFLCLHVPIAHACAAGDAANHWEPGCAHIGVDPGNRNNWCTNTGNSYGSWDSNGTPMCY